MQLIVLVWMNHNQIFRRTCPRSRK
uniref:Uncharacterized protein n=1 Tax=Rhizophora mucronata TaxID=61149 RepID=A0A2P2NJ56_RHIMU